MRELTLFCLILYPIMLVAQIDTVLYEREIKRYDSVNQCSYLWLELSGDTIMTAFCAKFHSKEYSFQTTYVNNEPFALMIYDNEKQDKSQVAEFWYIDGWKREDYHCKSMPYSNRLLKIYLRKKNKVKYDQVWYQ